MVGAFKLVRCPHPWNLVTTPTRHPRILHLSPRRGPAPPVCPQSQPSHVPKHQDGTSRLRGMALQTSRTFYRPLHRTLKTIVNKMNPTSVHSCPLSRSPALCPLWYSCGYSPSGRRDRAHVLDGVVRQQKLKKTGPLTWEVLSPGRE